MKKLLLILGAVASVAAPVAAVVACSNDNESNTYGEFQKNVAAYQALQLMAFTSGNADHPGPITVVEAKPGTSFKYKSATVLDGKNDHVAVKPADKDQLLNKVKQLIKDTLVTYNHELIEIASKEADPTNPSDFVVKARAISTALSTNVPTFNAMNVLVEALADEFIDAGTNKFMDGDKLETTSSIKTASGKTLSDQESNLLKVGTPLLLKLVKTVEALNAI